MLPNKKKYSLDEILYIFELSWSDIPDIRKQHKSIIKAAEELEKFKNILKIAYRKTAKKYHPDLGGNPEDFKIVNNIYQMIKKFEIKRIEAPRPMGVRVVRVYSNFSSGSTTTSATTNGYW